MENPQPPQGPQSPAPGPQSPAGFPPPPAPPQGYGGPVPPGGWQQPIPQGGVPGGAQLASWGSRLGAWFIDGLIVSIPFSIVFFGLFGVAVVGEDAGFFAALAGLILTAIAYFFVQLLYAPLLMMRQGAHNGQTLGKQLLDIRAVRDNGQAWTFWPAAVREVAVKGLLVTVVTYLTFSIAWLLNYLWPLWDDQNRALHDMVVSSHVVKT